MSICQHNGAVRDITPSARGCQECLEIGSPWVHLRICRTCGHVGCCDQSRIGTPRPTITRRAIGSWKAMIHPRAGDGVKPTRSRSTFQTRPHNGGRYRATIRSLSLARIVLD